MRALIIAVSVLLTLTGAAAGQPYGVAIPVTNDQIRVLDGDTVRLKGHPVAIRLVGFNTPETSHRAAACPAEIEHGKRARTRLRELLASGPLTLTYVQCACRPGTEGTSACNHGRSCGTLRRNATDIGEILITEGHAARFICTGTSCSKMPRPWCE